MAGLLEDAAIAAAAFCPAALKPPTTFLSLPAELRNRIYYLSGCLQFYQLTAGNCRFIQAGDFKPTDHLEVHGCPKGTYCDDAYLEGFLNVPKAFLIIDGEGVPQTKMIAAAQGVRCWAAGLGWLSDQVQFAPSSHPALTKVSRQIRDETLPIFYGNHPFVIFLLGSNDKMKQKAAKVIRWLRGINCRAAGLLRDIEIIYSKKRALRYLERTFVPELGRCGVKSDEAVISLRRLEHPFDRDQNRIIERLQSRYDED